MLRNRSVLRTVLQAAGVGFLLLPIAGALGAEAGNPEIGGAVWYHDGAGRIQIVHSADTLNVVIEPAFSGSPPAAVLRHAIDRIGRHVLVRPPDVEAARRNFLAMDEVESVQSVYYRSEAGRAAHDRQERLTANGRIAISINRGESILDILIDFELTFARSLPYSPMTFVAAVSQSGDAVNTAQSIFQSGRVRFAVPQFARTTNPREIPDDPLFPDQWHLLNAGQNGGTPGEDLNIVSAWDTATGISSLVAIVDNGVDVLHPDLADNIDPAVSYDFNDNDDDPRPDCDNAHGTVVAGISGAVTNNRLGVSGVAPGSTLGAIRLTAAPFSDEDTADALIHRLDLVDIYNNSWGPRDNGQTIEGPGILTSAALEFGIQYGRGGLGAIYVWAGGNGGFGDDDANFDGFVNSRYTIGVGASNNLGWASGYSERGACILVNAPSSGGFMSITTTDISGSCGSEPGDYTYSAGGTSASAPMVAGVVAMMLEVNPGLTWRDVQHILLLSATQNDPDDPGWTANGAGLPVHYRLGFGRVDAAAALELAADWSSVVPPLLPVVSFDDSAVVSAPIPDGQPNGVQLILDTPDRFVAEHIEVTVDITHARRGDLEIVLTSPAGTESILASRRSADFGEDLNWRFMTVRHWNEPTEGAWTLTVRDRANGVAGTINSWRLAIHGRHLDLPLGDLNADGEFDSFDIAAFFLAILDSEAYTDQYPGISAVYLGDFDGDGELTAFDLPGFALGLFE